MWADSSIVPPWEWRAAQWEGKQTVQQTEPPVLLIGEKPATVAEESLLAKIGKAMLDKKNIHYYFNNDSLFFSKN